MEIIETTATQRERERERDGNNEDLNRCLHTYMSNDGGNEEKGGERD